MVVLAFLLLTIFFVYVRGFSRRIHCGYNQSQLMGAMVAYSTERESKAWVVLNPRVESSSAGGARGRLVTTRWMEAVAASQSLPNALFKCQASNSLASSVKPQPADPTSTWGLEAGRYLGYAVDWAAPIDPSAARPMIADRDPTAHRDVLAAVRGGSAIMVVFGDAHMKMVPVTWVSERPRSALVTDGVDGLPVSLETVPMPGDDIYSAEGDAGDPLTPGKGDPLRAWVK